MTSRIRITSTLLCLLVVVSGENENVVNTGAITSYQSLIRSRWNFPGTNGTRWKSQYSDAAMIKDPVFQEVMVDGEEHEYPKRGALEFYNMVKCGTGCNPLVYKGYGCFCGFLGSGKPVDGIDRCCKMHDWCYTTSTCMGLQFDLPYFVPYKWACNGGAPYCIPGNSKDSGLNSCSHHLCECDREFVACLAEFKCPRKKAMCRSPWRYFQNLFMGLGTGMPLAPDSPHRPGLRDPSSFIP